MSKKPGDEQLIEEKIELAIEHPKTKGEAIEDVDTCNECRST